MVDIMGCSHQLHNYNTTFCFYGMTEQSYIIELGSDPLLLHVPERFRDVVRFPVLWVYYASNQVTVVDGESWAHLL